MPAMFCRTSKKMRGAEGEKNIRMYNHLARDAGAQFYLFIQKAQVRYIYQVASRDSRWGDTC
jgi:hypothetical protein